MANHHLTDYRRGLQGITARELSQRIGQTATYRVGDMQIDVEVLDIKYTWGQVRYLITPTAGYGNQWVQGSLQFKDAQSP